MLVRHAHALSNAGDVVNASPPGVGLSERGLEEAQELSRALAGEKIDLGVASRLRRAQETLAAVVAGRDVPRQVEPLLDEIGFGAFEGRPLPEYRAWAWQHEAGDPCPGGGESRVEAARRISCALDALLARPVPVVLAVSHALVVRYVLDACDGAGPMRRLEPVPHAVPFRLERASVETAAATLRAWAASPQFRDTPIGG